MNKSDLFEQEVQQTLDIPYTKYMTRSSIQLIAQENKDCKIAWEKDLLSGKVTFCKREGNIVFEGIGKSCLEAFANKKEL